MDENMKNQVADVTNSDTEDEGATTVLTSDTPVSPAMDDDEGETTVLIGGAGPQGMPNPGMAPQGMPNPGMAPQGMPNPGMAPQGMPNPGMAPQGMPNPGMMPQGMPNPGMMPQGMPNPGMMPQGMPNPGMMPQGMPNPGMAPQGMPNPGMMPGMQQPPKQKKVKQPKPPKQPKQPKQGGKKKVGLIVGIVVAVIAALGVGAYFLFFTPEKRLQRKLVAAQEAMDAQKYEDARTNYKAALEIDDENVEAMLGMIQAETEIGETDQAKTDADVYRAILRDELDEEVLQSESDRIVTFYQEVGDLYGDDPDKQIEIYKEGYELVNDGLLQSALIEAYLDKAETYDVLTDYEEVFDLCDEVLSLQSGNEEAKTTKSDAAQAVLDDMMASEMYDEAEAFIEKYGDIEGVDFASYTSEIEEQREIINARHDLMEQTISLMGAGDFVGMLDVDGSENASLVIDTMEGDCYIYSPDGYTSDFTGTAAGIYKYGDSFMSGYYFYYGEYKNGVRDGQGTYFMKTDGFNDAYELYEGLWSNDKPNGQGKMTRVNEDSGDELVTRTWECNYTDGLANGEVTMTLTDADSVVFSTTITAEGGSTTDVRDQYPDYDFSEVGEDAVVYAVLTAEGTDEFWWFSHNGNGKIGVSAFITY